MNKKYGNKAEKQAAYRARKKRVIELPEATGSGTIIDANPDGRITITNHLVEVQDLKTGGALEAGLESSPGGNDLVRAGSTPAPPENLSGREGGEKVAEGDRVKAPGTQRPAQATSAEWDYALERAERAARYAVAMPEQIRPGDRKYQDPVWQWENETKGRVAA